MSGTASANIFSSDPAKKFDVIFSIDMKQLLTALGAKPEQVAKVLAAAEQNRRKPIQWGTGSGMMMAADAAAGPNAATAAPAGGQGTATVVRPSAQPARPAAAGAPSATQTPVAGGAPPADMTMSRGQFSEKELAAATPPRARSRRQSSRC